MIEVLFERGLCLPRHGLWLDPWDARPVAFVSHAHADHIAPHREVILSRGTSALFHARIPGAREETVLDFHQGHAFQDATLTLIPAGHILGSAQLHVENPDGSLLYTGDFKLRAGLSAEPATFLHAETLIMETTYGLPHYQFPPTEQVLRDMVQFCQETLEEEATPVLFGYSLGKAQEILWALGRAGLVPMLHDSVFRMTQIYGRLRADLPPCLRYDPAKLSGHVFICPPSVARSRVVQGIANRRTLALTGWAMDSGSRHRNQVDAALPLSDHADYNDLLRHVENVNPKRVLTVHGFALEFAADLRQRGIEAWAIGRDNQLELGIVAPPTVAARIHAPVAAAHYSPFLEFARTGEEIASVSGRLRKIEILADYLSSLDADALEDAARYFSGRAFAQGDPRVLNIGSAVVRQALLALTGVSPGEYKAVSRRLADISLTTQQLYSGSSNPVALSFGDVRSFFSALAQTRGPLAKARMLEERFASITGQEAAWLVKIMIGDARIGLKEGLLEEAIAQASGEDADAVRHAHMLTGDAGQTAKLAITHQLDTARLEWFRPVRCMLAGPEPDAVAVWERMQHSICQVEDKFDGIRAQMHLHEGRVEIYSRDLKCVTRQFQEIASNAGAITASLILDGEIVAFRAGRPLSFFELQKRLGRTDEDLFMKDEIPVRYVAFDLLRHNDAPLLSRPLSERRAILDTVHLPAQILRSEIREAASPQEIDTLFRDARKRGNEGLMIKDPASAYTPGRRGLVWVKLKKEYATLDVVVVAVEWGHGKRKDVLSDYTFAVRRSEQEPELLTIGKAYSGLTDKEIATLTEYFLTHTISEKGRAREVEPQIVLEIAFDSIQPSKRHGSGLAMRFPRIKRIRTDKSPSEIDTLATARKLSI